MEQLPSCVPTGRTQESTKRFVLCEKNGSTIMLGFEGRDKEALAAARLTLGAADAYRRR